MSKRKIIGVTVGTNINPQKLSEYVEDGKSAYELAVEHGFKGTEKEWVASLNGKDGVDGHDGYTPVKGVDYFDGKDGQDGYTPVKGKDYFDGINGQDGVDGVGIEEIYFNDDDEMIISMTDGSVKNLGKVVADIDVEALSTNMQKGAGKDATQQLPDGVAGGFSFKGKNANAATYDETVAKWNTGEETVPYGATGDYASAFGGKSAAIGKRSHAEGTTTIAKGAYSHAEGDNTVTLGSDSHAEGLSTVSKGNQSHAEGSYTIAEGGASHAEGGSTITIGAYAHAEGEITVANGQGSHAEGGSTKAIGVYTHAEGESTQAIGRASHTEGKGAIASGDATHAEGLDTRAEGKASHSEGCKTFAKGVYSHSEGWSETANNLTVENIDALNDAETGAAVDTNRNFSIAQGQYSHNEGVNTVAWGNGSHAEGRKTLASGIGSHAEGNLTTSSGHYSHVEGENAMAKGQGSHAEGISTQAEGHYSHAEGSLTAAYGRASHAEGSTTSAEGVNSHAEGLQTSAIGEQSHAEGKDTQALGDNSHTSGLGTMTMYDEQFAAGRYNDYKSDTLFEIGNGYVDEYSDIVRSNAFEVYADGSARVYGSSDDPNGVVRNEDLEEALSNIQIDGNISPMIKITYAELKSLRDNSKLVPGVFYRITDYRCTTIQENTRAINNQFDIIVQALSENTLSENAKTDYHYEEVVTLNGFINPSAIESENVLKEDAVTVIYYEYIDMKGVDFEGLNEYKTEDVFIAYDYIANNGGISVPVIYKTNEIGLGEDASSDYTSPDYGDQFFYVGREYIDNIEYDKWRKIDCDDTNLGWDSASKIYLYTNPIVLIDSITTTTQIVGIQPYEANIPAWDIKYCFDNDASRFTWADANSGRGVIYYMKDDYNNECPYDFKNIQFIRMLDEEGSLDLENGENTWCYTFGGKQCDRSIRHDDLKEYNNNSIGNYYMGCSEAFIIPDNVFLGVAECMTKCNRLGNNCNKNTFGPRCQSNTFGNGCGDNIFGYSCEGNYFGYECVSNTFGDNCSANIFGNRCHTNTLGDTCCYNTFGNYCNSIFFGCDYQDIIFDNNCHNIIFGTSTTKLLNYAINIRFESGCGCIHLINEESGDYVNAVKNITISTGVIGDWSSYRELQVPRNSTPIVFEAPGTTHIILD